jgi:DNA-directed RNA polymerase specialized sigma24 family protein
MEEQLSLEDLPQFMVAVRAKARALLRKDPYASIQITELINSATGHLLLTIQRKAGEATWKNRDHFLATFYRAMMAVLYDHAKRRHRQKRDVERTVALEDLQWDAPLLAVEETPEQIIALKEVLEQLEQQHPAWVPVIQGRLLGLTMAQIAEFMEVSTSTISRTLDDAEYWCDQQLLRRLNEVEGSSL